MNIPVEAVEAAAFELYKDDHWGQPTEWPTGSFADGLTLDEFKEDYRKVARSALEAAAPFMLLKARHEAWEEGMSYSLPATPRGIETFDALRKSNPYRDVTGAFGD